MNDTWIKLYRKILKNDALFRSRNTFPIWCWLLLMADYKTGVVTCGRYQISQWLKIKPSTVYLTLKRLENLTMIKMKPNNKMTTIYILNWHEYQSKPNNKMTTNQQQNDTNQEYKNIRSKNKNIYSSIKDLTDDVVSEIAEEYSVSVKVVDDLKEELRLYCLSKGRKYKNYKAALQTWLRKRIKENPSLRVRRAVKMEEVEKDPDGLRKIEALKKRHGLS